MKYFAYGSNMLRQRLLARIPGATFDGRAQLRDHVLRFHKIGDDGSGKGDAYHTGITGDVVHGILYEIGEVHKEILDVIEGVGLGYDLKHVTVEGEIPVDAYIYVVDPDYIDPAMKPFSWYRDFVLAGAMQHHLPHDYITAIRQVPVKEDPDRIRAAENRMIMARAGIELN